MNKAQKLASQQPWADQKRLSRVRATALLEAANTNADHNHRAMLCFALNADASLQSAVTVELVTVLYNVHNQRQGHG